MIIINYEQIDFRSINEENREVIANVLKRNKNEMMLLADKEITEDTDLSELPEFMYKGVSDQCYLIGFFTDLSGQFFVSYYDGCSPYGAPSTMTIDEAFGGLDSIEEYDAVTWFFDKWNTKHAQTNLRKEGAFTEHDMTLIGESHDTTLECDESGCTMVVCLSLHGAEKLVDCLNKINGYDAWSIEEKK